MIETLIVEGSGDIGEERGICMNNMRIISQNGDIDIPYNLVSIQREKSKIYAQGSAFANCKDNYVEMAIYSTEEKAKRAMEMLMDTYLAHMGYVLMSETQRALYLSILSEEEQKEIQGFFKFPAENNKKVNDENIKQSSNENFDGRIS